MTSLLLLVAAAAAAPSPPPIGQPVRESSTVTVRLHCTDEPVTGSRFTRRVCQSEEQMLARQEADRQAFAEIVNQPRLPRN